MAYAIQQVKAAQQRLRGEQTGESTDPSRESLQRTETMVVQPDSPGLVAQWLEKYPETYRRFLRAAARIQEPDRTTRHRLYEILNCVPEEQE